jgi:hypothetical protein
MKTTIVFRGLMVLHPHGDTMEIGFVDALYNGSAAQEHNHNGNAATQTDHPPNHHEAHVPRILTTTDGVLSSIFDLRNRPELGTVRNWSLEVRNPIGSGISFSQQMIATTTGTEVLPFVRTATGSGEQFEKDFRWITDMEAPDLHGRDLSVEINTRQFLFVLYVPHGSFYTRLKSPVLRRKRRSSPLIEDYGPIAAAVGCDIEFGAGGGVTLKAGGSTGSTVFNFDHDHDGRTVYEISNGPPDVPSEEPIPLDAPNHFHMYYDKLFKDSRLDRFDLLTEDQAPAPDPTVCGVTYLGLRQDPL